MKRLLKVGLVALALFAGFSASGFSYSFNAYNGMTGAGTLTFTPTFATALSLDFAVNFDPVISYGFSDHFDIFADVGGMTLANDFSYNYAWIMPRFEFLPGSIIALQVQLDIDTKISLTFVPQYHFFYEADAFAFELNASVTLPMDATDAASVWGIIAPVWKAIDGLLAFYVEVDPAYTFSDGAFKLNLVPGIWLGIPDTVHSFCIAFPVSDITSGNPGFGINLWYSTAISFVPESKEMK